MKRATAALFLSALLSGMAQAQPAAPDKKIETVIVTAPKFHAGVTPNAIAHDFVKSFAAPTMLRDAIARWQVAICPDFEGIALQFAAVMQARFRTIAGQAGASMKEKGCRPNLFVVFTSAPQTMLDALHRKNADLLGYHGTTIVTYPIQAWYETGITDLDGQTVVDQDGMGLGDPTLGGADPTTGHAAQRVVGGWRFHPDLSSDLLAVTIIVDSQKTATFRVGEIADYVAMMALSRTEDYEDCQLVPSITNLLSANCDDKRKPDAITPTDIAYLRGVYKMDAGATLLIQQNQIAAEMQKAIPAASAGGK